MPWAVFTFEIVLFVFIFQCMASAFELLYPSGLFRIIPYSSRPVIRVRHQREGPIRTYSFVDAIVALKPLTTTGLNMTDTDLQSAYKAAGARFEGQLRELFIVLDDSSKHRIIPKPQASHPKRPRNDGDGDRDDVESVSKKSHSESVTGNLSSRMQRSVKI